MNDGASASSRQRASPADAAVANFFAQEVTAGAAAPTEDPGPRRRVAPKAPPPDHLLWKGVPRQLSPPPGGTPAQKWLAKAPPPLHLQWRGCAGDPAPAPAPGVSPRVAAILCIRGPGSADDEVPEERRDREPPPGGLAAAPSGYHHGLDDLVPGIARCPDDLGGPEQQELAGGTAAQRWLEKAPPPAAVAAPAYGPLVRAWNEPPVKAPPKGPAPTFAPPGPAPKVPPVKAPPKGLVIGYDFPDTDSGRVVRKFEWF